MKFTKMHGCGNDYVYINGFTEKMANEEKPDWVRKVSDRHFGIGSDGAIFINPSKKADFEMEMYNADGSRSEMCGNGIRCVGKYVYDYGLTQKKEITVESGGQIKYLKLNTQEGKVTEVEVNMGAPILVSDLIPVKSEKPQVIKEPLFIPQLNQTYEITCVSMGNPHAVIFLDEVAGLEIEKIGPYVEHHEAFPNRTNTEFVKVLDEENVEMRVWERGTGETLACGTGCCATAVACILNGFTKDQVTVHVLGGKIKIYWDRENNLVTMTGPACTVFEGEI